MNYDICLYCQNCDTSRKNDLGEVRCVEFSTFVKPSYKCDHYASKGLLNFAKELRKGCVDFDR